MSLALLVLSSANDAEENHLNDVDVETMLDKARAYRNVPQDKVPQNLWPSYHLIDPYGPETYAWGFEIVDPKSGNVQFRDEARLADGTVVGSYGNLLPNPNKKESNVIITKYTADQYGYRYVLNSSSVTMNKKGEKNSLSLNFRSTVEKYRNGQLISSVTYPESINVNSNSWQPNDESQQPIHVPSSTPVNLQPPQIISLIPQQQQPQQQILSIRPQGSLSPPAVTSQPIHVNHHHLIGSSTPAPPVVITHRPSTPFPITTIKPGAVSTSSPSSSTPAPIFISTTLSPPPQVTVTRDPGYYVIGSFNPPQQNTVQSDNDEKPTASYFPNFPFLSNWQQMPTTIQNSFQNVPFVSQFLNSQKLAFDQDNGSQTISVIQPIAVQPSRPTPIAGETITSQPLVSYNVVPTVTPPVYNYLAYNDELGSFSHNYNKPGWFKRFLETQRKYQLLRSQTDEAQEEETENSTIINITPVPVYINKKK